MSRARSSTGSSLLGHVDAPEPGGHAGVHLLPQWDELLLGYKGRDLALPPEHVARVVPGRNMVFKPTLVVDGEVAGTWRREQRSRRVVLEVRPFVPLGAGRWRDVERAAAAYGRFLGRDVEVVRASDGVG